MKWRIIQHEDRYLVCRTTWHSPEWMGIKKTDIRQISIKNKLRMVKVFADCQTRELADRLMKFTLL